MYEKYIFLGESATVRVANMKGVGSHPDQAVEERGTSMLDVRFSSALKAMLLLGHAEEGA
jgi:hypothetical protein